MVSDAQLKMINDLYSTTNQDEREILIEFLQYDVPDGERDLGMEFSKDFDNVNVERTLEVDRSNSVVSYVLERGGHKFNFTVTFTFVLDT